MVRPSLSAGITEIGMMALATASDSSHDSPRSNMSTSVILSPMV